MWWRRWSTRTACCFLRSGSSEFAARIPTKMHVATKQSAQLDRAYVQSRVIETNLQHLTVTLSEVDPKLRDDLELYAKRFEHYVRQLGDACQYSTGEL